MHTVERLEYALQTARQRGFGIRVEWLGGGGGGECEIRGRRWIFLDLADTPADQLEVVLALLSTTAPAQPHERTSGEGSIRRKAG